MLGLGSSAHRHVGQLPLALEDTSGHALVETVLVRGRVRLRLGLRLRLRVWLSKMLLAMPSSRRSWWGDE